MQTRTERLGYEGTLAALLGMIGTRVEVAVTPVLGDGASTVARISGVLLRGERRRQTLGAVPEDPDHEVVVFWLEPDESTGFALSKRVFGGASVERDEESVTVRVVVEPNEIVVAAVVQSRVIPVALAARPRRGWGGGLPSSS